MSGVLTVIGQTTTTAKVSVSERLSAGFNALVAKISVPQLVAIRA